MAKILYVDADCERTETVRRRLNQRGHRVQAAASAERAMMKVDVDSEFDVVVLHLILPGMDGAELCRWLKRWSPLAAAPRVVFSTPDVKLELELDGELPNWLPADLYLHCVDQMDSIVEAVERVLSSRGRPIGS